MPQDGFLFDETVRENIRFGREGAGDEAIDRVLETLSLTDWVHRLPGSVLDELDRVVRDAAAVNLTAADFDFEVTDIPALRAALIPIVDALAHGSGVALVRGMSVERYTVDELKMALLVWAERTTAR